jgi:hypothetical protein
MVRRAWILLPLLAALGCPPADPNLVYEVVLGDPLDGATGDDDDTVAPPPYAGEIDLDLATLHGSCTVEVEVDYSAPHATPEGYFEFEIEMEGWASECWINFWDEASDYCEAYDPDTGAPCQPYGYVRGGFEMLNDWRGWLPEHGFLDYWVVEFDYIMDLGLAEATDASIFICENAGNNFTTEFCCLDLATGQPSCVEYWDF